MRNMSFPVRVLLLRQPYPCRTFVQRFLIVPGRERIFAVTRDAHLDRALLNRGIADGNDTVTVARNVDMDRQRTGRGVLRPRDKSRRRSLARNRVDGELVERQGRILRVAFDQQRVHRHRPHARELAIPERVEIRRRGRRRNPPHVRPRARVVLVRALHGLSVRIDGPDDDMNEARPVELRAHGDRPVRNGRTVLLAAVIPGARPGHAAALHRRVLRLSVDKREREHNRLAAHIGQRILVRLPQERKRFRRHGTGHCQNGQQQTPAGTVPTNP